MKIDSRRLIIRRPIKKDAAALLEYLKIVGGETDHLTFGAEGHPNTVEQEEAYLEGPTTATNKVMLIAEYKGEIIADGSLGGSMRERLKHTLELGISVKKAYWRQGVGTKVMEALFAEARKIPHVIQIYLEVKCDNERAISAYEKLGFLRTGTIINKLNIGGKYYDTIIMVKPLR